MAGLSKQTAGFLVVGGIVVGTVAGRCWERTRQVAPQTDKAEIHATASPVAAVRRNEPLPPPDFALVEKAQRQLVSLFESAQPAAREVEVRRVLSRITASELRELGSRIIASTNVASLGRPDRTLEEFLFERLGAEFGAGFETLLKTIPFDARPRQNLAITAALDGWIGADIAGALEHFKQRPLDDMAGLLAARLAGVWWEKDSAGFVAYMRGLPRVYEAMPAKKQLVAVWAEHDPAAAFDWAWHYLDSDNQDYFDMVTEAFRGLTEHGMGEAIGALHEMADLKDRGQLSAVMIRSIDPVRLKDAMRELLKLPPGPLDSLFVFLDDRFWAMDQGIYVRLLIRAGVFGREVESLMGSALSRLAETDPAQAVALFREIPQINRGQMEMIGADLAARIAGSDLEAGIRFMQQDLNPQERSMALERAIGAAAKKDPTAALRLLDLAPESQKASLWNSWGMAVADSDPEKLKSYIAFMPPGSANAMLVGTAVAKMDLTSAGDWASTLPEGAGRVEAYRVLSARLSAENPKVAEQWLQTMPDIPERTAAVSDFVRKMTYKDTELAVRWALTLPDVETNPEPFERAAKYWLQTQHDKAAEYFRLHEVPEALRSIVQPPTR
jgi:hypothetical protein